MKALWESRGFPSSLAFEESRAAGDADFTDQRPSLGRTAVEKSKKRATAMVRRDLQASPEKPVRDAGSHPDTLDADNKGWQQTAKAGKSADIDTKRIRRIVSILVSTVVIGSIVMDELDSSFLAKDIPAFFTSIVESIFDGSGSDPAIESQDAAELGVLKVAKVNLDDDSILYTTAQKQSNQISYITVEGDSVHLAVENADQNATEAMIVDVEGLFSGATVKALFDVEENGELKLLLIEGSVESEPLALSGFSVSEVGGRYYKADNMLMPNISVEVVFTDLDADGRKDLLVYYDDYENPTVLEAFMNTGNLQAPFQYVGYIEGGRDFEILSSQGLIVDRESEPQRTYDLKDYEW